jgi:hypothetical protein
VCFTRYFRLTRRAGEDHRVSRRIAVARDLGFLYYEIVGADRSTFCVELIPPVGDRALRGLRHEAVHLAVARRLPGAEEWLDPRRSIPIGPIAAMGQERNLLRSFHADGRPLVLGLHVIGDTRCQTNSLYAWGSHLALASAATLADVLAEHPRDPEAQALAFEARISDEIAGRHALASARDAAAQRRRRGAAPWAGADPTLALIHETVIPAADRDGEIFRAVNRWQLQLDPVSALTSDPAILDRARALSTYDGAPAADEMAGPNRDDVLELIARLAPAAE